MTNKRREALIGYSFIGIWVIGFILLSLIPIIQSLKFSFQEVKFEVNGVVTKNIGLKNYQEILKLDLDFMDRIRLFVEQIVLYVPIIIVFSIIVSVMLNQKIKFKGIFRTIYFLPVIITSGPVITELFNQGATSIPLIEQYGVIQIISNSLPEKIAEPIVLMFSEMIFILWMSGVQILIFLSGLQKIDRSVYEAASIDGASPWEAFWKITLPSLTSLVSVNVLYTIVTLSSFSTNEVLSKIKRDMFSSSTGYGYASAEAWIYFMVVLIVIGLVALLFYLSKRKNQIRRG